MRSVFMWACFGKSNSFKQLPLLHDIENFKDYFLLPMHAHTCSMVIDIVSTENALHYPQLITKLIDHQEFTQDENGIAQLIYIDLSLRARLFCGEPVARIQALEKLNVYISGCELTDIFSAEGICWFSSLLKQAQEAISNVSGDLQFQRLSERLKDLCEDLRKLDKKCDATIPKKAALTH